MKIIHESGEGDRLKLCKMLMVSQREDRVVASFFCVDDVRHSSPPPPGTQHGLGAMVWYGRCGTVKYCANKMRNTTNLEQPRHHANAICKY